VNEPGRGRRGNVGMRKREGGKREKLQGRPEKEISLLSRHGLGVALLSLSAGTWNLEGDWLLQLAKERRGRTRRTQVMT